MTNKLTIQYGFQLGGDAAPIVVLGRTAIAGGGVDVAVFSVLGSDPAYARLASAHPIPFDDPDTRIDGSRVDYASEPGIGALGVARVSHDSWALSFTRAQVSTGRVYLGRVADPSNGHIVDVWGEHVTGPSQDACFYGGSGSSTVAADGWISGPTTWRNYLGTNSYEDNTNQPLSERRDFRNVLDQDLNMDTTGFDTVCATAAISTNTWSAVTALL